MPRIFTTLLACCAVTVGAAACGAPARSGSESQSASRAAGQEGQNVTIEVINGLTGAQQGQTLGVCDVEGTCHDASTGQSVKYSGKLYNAYNTFEVTFAISQGGADVTPKSELLVQGFQQAYQYPELTLVAPLGQSQKKQCQPGKPVIMTAGGTTASVDVIEPQLVQLTYVATVQAVGAGS